MLITNAKLYYNGEILEKDILIENSVIKKIMNPSSTNNMNDNMDEQEIINADGMLVFPGLIDVHVHMRDPGQTYKEDFFTGTRAAIAGGITTVIDMPNNIIPTINEARLREKQQLTGKKAVCDVLFYMGATKNNFENIKKANPAAIKVYMSETTGTSDNDELLLNDRKLIRTHFENFDKDKPVAIHAEGQKLIDNITEIGKTLKNRKRKIHLAHATTKEEIESIKVIDQNLATVEVAPHHLFLSKKHEQKLGKLALVKPPLHDDSDRKSLWQSLNSIDCIATDHAPHTLEDKKEGAYGFPGLETSLALLLDAYNKKLLELKWVVERMAANPAKIFNLNDRGQVEIGKKADLIFVNLKQEWQVKDEELETKCKWSPFNGWRLKGKVKSVIKNGKLIYEDGEFLI